MGPVSTHGPALPRPTLVPDGVLRRGAPCPRLLLLQPGQGGGGSHLRLIGGALAGLPERRLVAFFFGGLLPGERQKESEVTQDQREELPPPPASIPVPSDQYYLFARGYPRHQKALTQT